SWHCCRCISELHCPFFRPASATSSVDPPTRTTKDARRWRACCVQEEDGRAKLNRSQPARRRRSTTIDGSQLLRPAASNQGLSLRNEPLALLVCCAPAHRPARTL